MSADFNAWNRKIIDEFRANGGRVGGMFEGSPLVVVHTTGAKTGTARENPLVPLIDGARMYVFASKGGAPRNPDWYHNLKANPAVRVEHLMETFDATAVEVEDAVEHERVYSMQASLIPSFADYAQQTARRIPVIELVRS
jgi:deazaflavin-dependent oxidoreductase (nitroreductase family)